MKIVTQFTEDHQARLTAEIEPELLEQMKYRAARRLAQRVKIPGFRPGKAPYQIILRHVGEAAVLEEAVDLLVDDIYPKVIDEAKIQPYGPGSLENIEKLDPPTFEFLIPLKATVELGDYKSLRVDYEAPVVEDKAVDDVIEDLRQRQATIELVDRAAAEGDQVYIQLNGTRTDPENEESALLIKDQRVPVIIENESTKSAEEWPFPGFSRTLVGLSAGEHKTVEHVFDEESVYETLRGAKASFEIHVDEVKSRTLPELNDEFAQSVSTEYATLDDLRSAVRTDLEETANRTYHEEYDDRVIEQVVQISTIKYPPQMLEHELDHVVERMKDQMKQQGIDPELYLKSQNKDEAGFRQDMQPVAERRMKKSLVVMELSDAESISVSPDELQEETNRTLGALSGMMPEKDFRSLLQGKDSSTSLVGNIMMDMLVKRTLEHMRRIANGTAELPAAEPESETPDVPASEATPADEIETAAVAELDPAQPMDDESAAAAASEDLKTE